MPLLRGFLLLSAIILTAREAFSVYPLPFPLNEQSASMKEACNWIRDNNAGKKKIYYYDPLVSFFLDVDPYNTSRVQELVPDLEHPERDVEPGEWVVWDAHFSPNEGRLPLGRMLNNKFYKVEKIFRPKTSQQVMGGHEYEIYIFKRVGYRMSGMEKQSIENMDFDTSSPHEKDSSGISTVRSLSGTRSFLLNPQRVYSPEIRVSLYDLPTENHLTLEASAFFYPTEAMDSKSLLLVLSFENKGKMTGYNTVSIPQDSLKINTWNEINIKTTISASYDIKEIAKMYIWNNSGKPIYIDDFKAWINVAK